MGKAGAYCPSCLYIPRSVERFARLWANPHGHLADLNSIPLCGERSANDTNIWHWSVAADSNQLSILLLPSITTGMLFKALSESNRYTGSLASPTPCTTHIFKIVGGKTNKPPTIIHPNLFIFQMLSPYPQYLIVLWVYSGMFYSSCRYGCSGTSCLVGIAAYENPNIQLHFLKTSVEDFLTMAIRSTSWKTIIPKYNIIKTPWTIC